MTDIDYAYNPDIPLPEAGIGLLDYTTPERERTFLYDLRAERGDNAEHAPERKAYIRAYYWKAKDHLVPRQDECVINQDILAHTRFFVPKNAPEYELPLFPTINYENADVPHFNAEDIILLQRGTH